MKQGEAKTLTLTVKDNRGVLIDLSDATLFLGVKKTKNSTDYTFSKDHADFDLTQAEDGVVSVDLTAEDTQQAEATYIGELKCTWAATAQTLKSKNFKIEIEKAITA